VKPWLNTLRYFAGDAWDEFRHSPGVNLLAVGTLAAALFVAGLLLLWLHNLSRHIERLREDVRVEIYLDDAIEPAARRVLRQRLESTDGVARVEYIDKDEALRRFREWSGDQAGLIGELGGNPLPASFDVLLKPGPAASEVGRLIQASTGNEPGVDEARFDEDWLARLETAVDVARWGGLVVGLAVFAAVVFVMASVLRLAVYARRDEIDIMLLVGATPRFVRGPFLVAGIGQGVIAAGAALALIETGRRVFLGSSTGSRSMLADLAGLPLPFGLSALLVLTGLVVGVTSAFFAVRRGVTGGAR
jgi:cell division transport system permease protein